MGEWDSEDGTNSAPVAQTQEVVSVQDQADEDPLSLQSPAPIHCSSTSRGKRPASAVADTGDSDSGTEVPQFNTTHYSRPGIAGPSRVILPSLQIHPPTPAHAGLPPPDSAFPPSFSHSRSPSGTPAPSTRRPLNFVELPAGRVSGTFRPSVVMRPPSGFAVRNDDPPYHFRTVGGAANTGGRDTDTDEDASGGTTAPLFFVCVF